MNTSWWRGVGPTHNLFVIESFIDELATAAKVDPVAYRRSMLQKNPRALAVLNLAAEKSGWGSACRRDKAAASACNSRSAAIYAPSWDAEVQSTGEVVLKRAVGGSRLRHDGQSDIVRAQIEGGLIMGLSTALYSEITLTNGVIDQSNFHDYRILRINEAPKIEVHRIESSEEPGGIGEAATASAAPALGNAIFAATGKRLRRLPFGNGQLRAAAG